MIDFKALFASDKELIAILTIIAELELPDAWLAAGALRNYVWMSYQESQVCWIQVTLMLSFLPLRLLMRRLKLFKNSFKWPTLVINGKSKIRSLCMVTVRTAPYQNARGAISKYPERCTAIAARLKDGDLELFLPYGDDIVNFIVQLTPHFLADEERMAVYRERLKKKDWQKRWPRLQILA